MSTYRKNRRTGGTFKMARDIVVPVAIAPGTLWRGKAYRSYTDTDLPRNITALDIVNYEADELGNEDIRTQANSVGLDLSKISQVMWVTKLKSVAGDYGTPQSVDVEGWTVIAEDHDGGYLVVRQ